ncbi:MAG TPA: glycerophosphodiester phosphodiesterase [Candidatus Limnocylindria bacterium]|nr:glycerophosphodiester phosphodiesterase [Candidatus Limnocylindria bacterium]
MRRIGHRGAKAHAPENTIASFQKALDLGCDEIETDVWLMDGDALVISHDRPASVAGLLTLDDVLDFCRGRMAVNVELKCGQSDAQAAVSGERVARHLRRRADADVYVSSFWYPALAAARAAAPAVRRAFVFGAAPDMDALLMQARALELWALHPEHWYVTPERVAAAHAAGLVMNAWTVNDPAEIATLAGWGVDGIMSDHPERVPKG